MPFSLRRPSDASIRAFLARQEGCPFSYAEVGASRDASPPHGYVVDRNRTRLGQGPVVFERAVAALRRWAMFDIGWVHLCWPDTPMEPGATVAVLIRPFVVYSLNACRIVYTVHEDAGSTRRFGFAYGTLEEHGESGEERFTVELCDDGSVFYDILAFSRPGLWLVRAGYPAARALQKRFARDSMAAMRRAVSA